ncbi:hypothetical protein [Xanthomonas campestris]|uniref:hypothetical protein n=1 Tax=Xanthomonas campestris TaxID=339 RepID=UPI001E52BF39|nr:hypothetical protein [Xanthomonas campestris pv. parthenii]
MSSASVPCSVFVPAPTAAYWHLCLPTHQGVPLFADWRCARAAAATLAMPRHWHGAQLLCWVLLPQHWCGLLQAPGKAGLLQLAGAARLAAGEAVNRARGRGGTIWQPEMQAAALPADIDHRQFARSLVASPLRAGLVDRIGAYPYWDAVWLQRDGPQAIEPAVVANGLHLHAVAGNAGSSGSEC